MTFTVRVISTCAGWGDVWRCVYCTPETNVTRELKYKLNLKKKTERSVLEGLGAVRRLVSGSILGRESQDSLVRKKSLI